jgi:hypothetical protein
VDRLAGDEEGGALAELHAVGIGHQEAVLGGVIFRDEVGERGGMGVPQDPFHVLGGGNAAIAVPGILDTQVNNLHRVFRAGEQGQALAQAVGIVLKDGVAGGMANAIGLVGTGRQGCGAPYFTGFLIAQVEDFTARVAHRVV